MNPPTERMTLRARTPEDLLALVPVVLGFEPAESLTLLSFEGRRPFHARIDLPAREHDEDAIQALVDPVVQHAVSLVAVIVHSHERARAAEVGGRLLEALAGREVAVIDVLLTDGRCWATLDAAAGPWTAYDVSAHPFVVQAVVRGDVMHASREELAASLDPDPGRVERVAALAEDGADQPGPVGTWLAHLVSECLSRPGGPRDDECARLLTWLDRPDGVDAVIDLVEPGTAAQHADLWRAVLRAAPESQRDLPAMVMALCAWLAGHGALAWCALDRLSPEAAEQGLARAVRTALERAVPPDAWWQVELGDPA